jgi:hypothetical protein
LCRRINPGQARAHSLGEVRVPGVERQEYPHLMPSLDLPALPEQNLSLMALKCIRMHCLWVYGRSEKARWARGRQSPTL